LLSSAKMPAAAKIPTCRMAPPIMRRWRTARVTMAREPASSEPPGAPNPLESETPTRSNGAASPLNERSVAAATFQRRARRDGSRYPVRARRQDAYHLILREDNATGAIVRVLDFDERGGRVNAVVRGLIAAGIPRRNTPCAPISVN
jgi:hypothetical protein